MTHDLRLIISKSTHRKKPYFSDSRISSYSSKNLVILFFLGIVLYVYEVPALWCSFKFMHLLLYVRFSFFQCIFLGAFNQLTGIVITFRIVIRCFSIQ